MWRVARLLPSSTHVEKGIKNQDSRQADHLAGVLSKHSLFMFEKELGGASVEMQILTQQVVDEAPDSPFLQGDDESVFCCSRIPSPILNC